MSDKKYIVIDTLGSDKGPEEIVKGAAEILKKHTSINVSIVGPEEIIKKVLAENDADLSRVEIVPADDTITNLDNPITSLFSKPNASILQAIKLVGSDEKYIGMIGAGCTGALFVCATKYLMKETHERPCLAAVLPTSNGGFTCLVDTGANIDCTKEQLHHFAIAGSEFMKFLYKIDKPRIGLLSNGAEPTKGNKLVKETHQLLKEDTSLNFIGNIEGNRSLSGDCDVLVCDGFDGNQVLKNSEGMAVNIITEIVKYSKKFNKPETMQLVQYLMGIFDFSSLGGAILLGLKKNVIKCRGNSGYQAIANTADILVNISENKGFYEGK